MTIIEKQLQKILRINRNNQLSVADSVFIKQFEHYTKRDMRRLIGKDVKRIRNIYNKFS